MDKQQSTEKIEQFFQITLMYLNTTPTFSPDFHFPKTEMAVVKP